METDSRAVRSTVSVSAVCSRFDAEHVHHHQQLAEPHFQHMCICVDVRGLSEFQNIHCSNDLVQSCIESLTHVESACVHLCHFQSPPPNRKKNMHISTVFCKIHKLILSLVEEALLRPKVNLVDVCFWLQPQAK